MKIKDDSMYQPMPELTAEEYDSLKKDIAEHGIQQPIVVDEEGTVIDGHHRIRACRELGITITDTMVKILPGLTEDEKLNRAVSLNLKRRNLSSDQKSQIIHDFMTKHPDYSARKIADIFGVSHTTVASVKKKFAVGQIGQVQTVQGSDGKTYASSKGEEEQQRQDIRTAIKKNPDANNHQIAQSLGVSDHTVKKQRDLIQTESMQSSDLPSSEQEDIDAYTAPYNTFSKDDLSMLLQDEVKSEDEWLHFLLEDFDEDSKKKAVLFSEEGIKTALDGLADLKRVIEKYEAHLNSRNPSK